jgi:raffinose/stachyose/melibiose transport system permease protein
VTTVVGLIVLSSAAAWAIARNWEHRLFCWSYFYLLAAMFIPFPVIALPQLKLTSIVHLSNPAGVAILHILFGLSFNVLLYSAFLRSIPYELEESARLDCATTWKTFWRLIFPLLAPMNATVGIFAVLQSWNDFMMPSLITANPQLQSLPSHPEHLPVTVQLQLQRRLRLLPYGPRTNRHRLPVRPALGHGRRHPRRHQGLAAPC